MIKGRSTGKIKCKEAVVIGKTLVYNRGVQAGREFSLPECILETDEFTLYKDGKHMIKVQEYRGHIRNWEALCEELCIDKSLSRREREERILVRAFETWQFDSVSETSLARSRSTIMRRKMDSFSMEQQSGESWSSQGLSKN